MQWYRDEKRTVWRLKLGPLKTNCFIVKAGGAAFIIDPVDDAPLIASYLDKIGVTLDFGMQTHCHFDHIGAAAGLIESGRFGELWYHADDAAELARGKTYSLLIARQPIALPPESHCRHYDKEFEAMLGALGFAIEHLPGHTPGSCIIYSLDRAILFTGDIILNNRVPGVRTAVGENRIGMKKAVNRIAETFGPRTLVFPGHGGLTLLETELAYNSTVKSLLAEAA